MGTAGTPGAAEGRPRDDSSSTASPSARLSRNLFCFPFPPSTKPFVGPAREGAAAASRPPREPPPKSMPPMPP